MPYEQLEEGVTADVTYRAWGDDLSELFAAAGDATVGTMLVSLDSLRLTVHRRVSLRADALDLLLMRFLDEVIFLKDAEGLLTRARGVHVEQDEHGCRLEAELAGEPIDRERHELSRRRQSGDAGGLEARDGRARLVGAVYPGCVSAGFRLE